MALNLKTSTSEQPWSVKTRAITPDEPITFYNAACNCSLPGEVKKAFGCPKKAITSGMARKDWIEHRSDLGPIRQRARFQELLRRTETPKRNSPQP